MIRFQTDVQNLCMSAGKTKQNVRDIAYIDINTAKFSCIYLLFFVRCIKGNIRTSKLLFSVHFQFLQCSFFFIATVPSKLIKQSVALKL